MSIVQRAAGFLQRALNLTAPTVSSYGMWYSNVFWPWTPQEFETGAWQRNLTPETLPENLLRSSPVYACVTGIASDIAKVRIKLDELEDGIWQEIDRPSPFLAVLRKPNHYQTRIEFFEQWVLSKLLSGNTYVLKEREVGRGIVRALYILHPWRVKTLVADDGAIFYELQPDNLSQVPETVTVPASEVIHDRMPALYHPLIGVSPLMACAMAAVMGNKIQTNSSNFFANQSRPSGILSTPAKISAASAAELKAQFEAGYGGTNAGKIAVLGDGMKFEAITMTAQNAQLYEQLKFTVEDVARVFHYPAFKLGGAMPPYAGNVDALITDYYTSCLHVLIEKIESLLDEGLELPENMGTEFDLDNLIRMDMTTKMKTVTDGIKGMVFTPNEGRRKYDLEPIAGGDSVYGQEQDHSLEWLSRRDSLPPEPPAAASTQPAEPDPTTPKPLSDAQPEPRDFDYEDLSTIYSARFTEEFVA